MKRYVKMKKLYEMTSEDLQMLQNSAKMKHIIIPDDPEYDLPKKRLHNAWKKLGEKYGFIWDTVEPTNPDDGSFKDMQFYATPKDIN